MVNEQYVEVINERMQIDVSIIVTMIRQLKDKKIDLIARTIMTAKQMYMLTIIFDIFIHKYFYNNIVIYELICCLLVSRIVLSYQVL